MHTHFNYNQLKIHLYYESYSKATFSVILFMHKAFIILKILFTLTRCDCDNKMSDSGSCWSFDLSCCWCCWKYQDYRISEHLCGTIGKSSNIQLLMMMMKTKHQLLLYCRPQHPLLLCPFLPVRPLLPPPHPYPHRPP